MSPAPPAATASALLAAPGLALFVQPAPAAPPLPAAAAALVHAWVFDDCDDHSGEWARPAEQLSRRRRARIEEALTELPRAVDGRATVRLLGAGGRCECVRANRGAGPRRAVPPASGERRVLLRLTAAESATPGLNWALGFDCKRVLEEVDEAAGTLRWLISVDADEEEDMLERIACGVQGEAFRRDGRPQRLCIERVDARCALVLPEVCRTAALRGAATVRLAVSFTCCHQPTSSVLVSIGSIFKLIATNARLPPPP